MVNVLSFDPGHTTGWAYQDEDKLKDMGNIKKLENVVQFLEDWKEPVDHVVIEDYKIHPKQAKMNVGSSLETVRVLGYIESWCLRNKIEFNKYPASLTSIQAKQTGMDPKRGNHADTHCVYAANHGAYYLIQKGLKKTALQKSMEK